MAATSNCSRGASAIPTAWLGAWTTDLYCADAGSDERCSWQIANVPEKLCVVEHDRFYGWPDHVVGKPVTDASFAPA